MSYVLDHHNVACDPFGQGLTNGIQMALGSWLTHGMRFALPLGGVILWRRRLYPDVGRWVPCGMARPDAAMISNWPGFLHEADMAFQYTVSRVLGNGFISGLREPVRVDFDSEGALIDPPLPMFPLGVVATPIAGGKFRVTWTYDDFGEGAPPTDFQVFSGATPETVDYDTALTDSITSLDYVPFLGEMKRHVFTSATYLGTSVVYGVRARNSEGVAEQNVYTSESKTKSGTAPTDAELVDLRMRRS